MHRHEKQKLFSLRQINGFDNIVDVDTSKWTDKTPEGLAKFVQKELPNWKQLIIVKNIVVIDSQKKQGDNIVSKKQSSLQVGRIGTGGLCLSVNPDLTVNGCIPQHIYKFFGGNARQG